VLHLRLIIFSVGCDVSVDSETLLMTNFINLKIKLTQSFKNAHSDRVYMRVFLGINIHMHISIYIYTVFLKKYSHATASESSKRRAMPNYFRTRKRKVGWITHGSTKLTHVHESPYGLELLGPFGRPAICWASASHMAPTTLS
jgi:hypothetical protein